MTTHRGRGFTLIEILVVIAIIGLLSVVAYVNLASAREKARIASGLRLESQIDHALSVDIRKDLALDSESMTCTYDGIPRWCSEVKRGAGSGALYQPNNQTLVILQTNDCLRGNCVFLNGGYMFIPFEDTSIGDLFADGGAVSLWFKQTDAGQTSGERALVTKSFGLNNNGYSVAVNEGNQIAFSIGTSGINLFKWTTPPGSVLFGKWNHVAVVYNRNNVVNEPLIYVNGRLMLPTKEFSWDAAYNDSAFNMSFGSESSGGRYFYGQLDEIRVYSTDANFNEI